MRAPITPCFWFESDSAGAAALYLQAFDGGRIIETTPMSTVWELYGRRLMGINGGPRYRPNGALSLFVQRSTEAEVRSAFELLARDGTVHMPLSVKEWSPLYGWVEDRYGVHWQIAQGRVDAADFTVMPALTFFGARAGRALEALELYTGIFSSSSVDERHVGEDGRLMFAVAHLAGQTLAFMDGPESQEIPFSEGASLSVACETQEEIDYFWDALVKGGQESRCGWLVDRFGVSWQVVPSILGELMSNPARAQRVVAAFMPMNKLDLETLLNA